MKTNTLGPLGPVSRLTLGGGGIGHIWGPSSHEESIATIHAALDGGIDLLDTAPMYGNCEAIVGETFGASCLPMSASPRNAFSDRPRRPMSGSG
jgi:aryl-alcohol dehydrogenase-like predicted oxidoreductase